MSDRTKFFVFVAFALFPVRLFQYRCNATMFLYIGPGKFSRILHGIL